MIKYKVGDIFKGDEDVIVHGCNCFCTFGAGVAFQVLKHYPDAFEEDKKTLSGDRRKLGTFTTVTSPHAYYDKKVTIVNAYTQFDCGSWEKPFDYSAFSQVLAHIVTRWPKERIAMPKIGAGLAGGDWDKITPIIDHAFGEREVVVYIYE